jgi:hypothetical protein
MKTGVEIDGQQGRQDVEGEKQQEVANHRLTVVGIPQAGSMFMKFHIHLKNYALQT